MRFFVLFALCANCFALELVVYSSRKEKFTRPLLNKFEREANVKVKLLSAVKVVRILQEQRRPLGNIFISNDVGQLEFLRRQGALRGAKMDSGVAIPPQFRAADYSWVGLSARSRILIYNRDLITEDQMPKTLWELTHPQWKGQFAITRGGNSSMIAHVAALSTKWGQGKTLQWLSKLKQNAGAITKGHTEIRQAVGRGEFKFGLVNNYYYHLQRLQKKHNQVAAIYPDQQGMGTFTNSAGVALLNNSTNGRAAETFMKWVVRPENQALFIQTSLEVPLNARIPSPTVAKRVDQYKTMEIPLDSLGEVWPTGKQLIERAGLDLAVR